MKKVKVIDFVKLNEVEIKNKLIELDFFIDEEDVKEVEFVENVDDDEICGGEDFGFDFSFKKSKFICCYLEENYGMTVYDSKEELVENFKDMFEVDTFEDLLIEMVGVYEIIEIKGECDLKFIVE